MQANEIKLRWVLKANAAFSLVSGVTLILVHSVIAELMDVRSPEVLLYVGIGLVLFSATVFQAGLRKDISVKQVQSIIVQDWVWVAGSAVIIGVQAWELSHLGYWMIAGVALLVADFAIFQMRFLKRI